ncbi:indolepyruvate ferredoxin oxidoreductase family protein [Kaustia mangrovi]|uniref:Indolepyruvate ferredoxin oxidoreductase family protein n=1 Tax=Kaustia mangrovi TaxID=2593653 RepID=A0A7S8C2M6_9HYPH|nr:indolepyruvate ferredoxin oxidoreductase family protein [Kaustia mangrovi]QPC42221.1 indolepyruvate ferredoxin oxidoreductase family protein [Kaustia mangrovi]
MTLRDVKLDDKYDLASGRIFLSGTQALVRLTLMQQARDAGEGLDTAGYVTGYRGSPLGGLDQQFSRAKTALEARNVLFQPALNEDLAATAVWGAQQAEMRGEGAHDGVFTLWYGKGPGVDRSGDVLRHGNAAGSSKHGGVLVLMGDDHTAESSTVAHQSEFALMDAMIPVLNPAGVQEILDYGLYGLALSRFSGCWVGLKCVKDTVESTAIVDGALDRLDIVYPDDFEMPEGGLNIRPNDERHDQEYRLHTYKRFAAVAFARANRLDRIVFSGGKAPKIGIVSTGKSYMDVRQALDELGIDEVKAADLGLRLLKVAMVWPLDPEIVEEFADGLDLIVVVEEKRSLIETQIREQLYGREGAPAIVGKKDEAGEHLFPAFGALDPNRIALAIGERLPQNGVSEAMAERIAALGKAQKSLRNVPSLPARIPYFCAGCPHNSSTVVPDGGRGYAGIGCHWMVQFIPERHTEGFTHMGGEGANWIGEAPFSERTHVFQNIGDGTYNHSGLLAIRAAKAAGVNITYKILYNDAVAMTGGQTHEGGLTVPMIARQMRAEGVDRIAVVSDEPDKYPANAGFPSGTTFNHRNELMGIQKELMEVPGVSVLIYDQTCAAEKRRRRKRGLFPDPPKRVFVNELVCEGCGDCGVTSNCVAVAPVETPFGRKRQIDQSVCNKDFSCLKGFCPSFVTVEGGELARTHAGHGRDPATLPFEALPEPDLPALDRPWSVIVTGIGGTGVVTIGQILGMAAHMEGKGAGIIDMAGLAQKNGAVATHMKIAAAPEDIATIRVAGGGADLLLGCDLMTSASEGILATLSAERSNAVVNSHETMPAQFTRDADFQLPGDEMMLAIQSRTRQAGAHAVDATHIASSIMGDSIATNMFTLGFAYQKGLVPVSAVAIDRAIALNGVAVEMNRQAFLWGRRAAHDLAAVERLIDTRDEQAPLPQETLDDMVERRSRFLTGYQDAAYAERYRSVVARVRLAEQKVAPGSEALSEAVARYYFKLLAYKDEYEVARLYTDGTFAREIAETFTGDYRIKFHMAPPLLARRDPETGELQKREYGPWMMGAFRLLARMKRLRGTVFDIFGYSAERRHERALIADYEAVVDELLSGLSRDNLALAAEIASVPEHIRGYGHVKERHLAEAKTREAELLAAFRGGRTAPLRAAAE